MWKLLSCTLCFLKILERQKEMCQPNVNFFTFLQFEGQVVVNCGGLGGRKEGEGSTGCSLGRIMVRWTLYSLSGSVFVSFKVLSDSAETKGRQGKVLPTKTTNYDVAVIR